MTSTSIVLIVAGVICLAVSAYAMYRMVPRKGRSASRWMSSESGETAMALGQFILMVAGLALLAKALF